MNCQQLIIGIVVLVLFISYTREGYSNQDYKVYKQASNSFIPKRKYRMNIYPYEWAYRANNFPLASDKEETMQPTAPMGACFTEGALWTCSL